MADTLTRAGSVLTGPDGLLDDTTLLGQSDYTFTERKFPLDVGASSYTGHFMVININVQENTQFDTITSKNVIKSFANDLQFNKLDNEYSKTDALRYNIDRNFTDGSGTLFGEVKLPLSRPRFTNRIVESIALYMPNSEMNFVDKHVYAENMSFTEISAGILGDIASTTGTAIGAAIGAVVGLASGGILSAALAAAGGWIGGLIGDTSGFAFSQFKNVAVLGGSPINPRTEVIFATTPQRRFAFEFMFAPESEEESRALENIIRTLRFHAAPEVGRGLGLNSGDVREKPEGWDENPFQDIGEFGRDVLNSIFFVPPSEFDITFYRRTEGGNIEENTHIPRINTCVLERVDVTYAPSGMFSTFSNGHPVAVRMMLLFTETEIAHKLRVLQGF